MIHFIFIYDGRSSFLQAIGSRNLLKSVAKQREAQQQQLHALITEKRMQLERLVKPQEEGTEEKRNLLVITLGDVLKNTTCVKH